MKDAKILTNVYLVTPVATKLSAEIASAGSNANAQPATL